MSKYLPPRNTPGLPQGAFNFIPRVAVTPTFEDPQDLEDHINLHLTSVVATVDVQWNINSIDYQVTQLANNVIVHSALIFYTLITVN